MDPISYRIDAYDRLVVVNDGWHEAAKHGGMGVAAKQVLGRELWDHIADPATAELYRVIIMRARAGHPVRFRYRCDTPTQRRVFVMDVRGEAGNEVSFTTTLIEQEDRTSIKLLETDRPVGQGLVRMCSWCQQIALPDGRWVSIEHAVAQLRLMEEGALPSITHGMCEACAKRIANAAFGGGE